MREAINTLTLRAAQRRSDATACRIAISTIGVFGTFFALLIALLGLGFPLIEIQSSLNEMSEDKISDSVDSAGRSLESLFNSFALMVSILILAAVALLFYSWSKDRGAADDESAIEAMKNISERES